MSQFYPPPETDMTDALGKQFTIELDAPDALAVTEWTAFIGTSGDFKVAGELENVGTERWQKAEIVVRFFDKDGNLVEVVSHPFGGQFVDPGERGSFQVITYIEPAESESYLVETGTPTN